LMNSLGNTLLIAANSRRNNEVINYSATSWTICLRWIILRSTEHLTWRSVIIRG
jgi:hypothetical protein